MLRRHLLALAAGLAVAVASQGADAAGKIKIGFLPGVVDPFYQVMQLGVEKAAGELGIDVVTQIPPTWGVAVQTPLLNAMVARGDLEIRFSGICHYETSLRTNDRERRMTLPVRFHCDAGYLPGTW